MLRKRFTFDDVGLYCVITIDNLTDSYERMVEKACLGGADVIQFRDRALSPSRQVKIGRKLREICEEHGVLFIINDRADLALACEADGVHLGQDDLPVNVARDILGYHRLIGRSTHSLGQALEAQGEGVDYVSCGPVWATPTKPGYPAVGLGLIKEYSRKLSIPFVAIGGINSSNIKDVVAAGARVVAVVRAVRNSEDVMNSTRILKEEIARCKLSVSKTL